MARRITGDQTVGPRVRKRPRTQPAAPGSEPALPPGLFTAAELPRVPPEFRKSYLALKEEYLRLRHLDTDEAARVPTHAAVLPKLRQVAGDGGAVAVIVLGIENLSEIEEAFGWQAADALLERTSELGTAFAASEIPSGALMAREGPFGEELLLFVPHPESPSTTGLVDSVAQLSARLQRSVAERLGIERLGVGGPLDGRPPRLASGYAVLFASPALRFERVVSRAVASARTMLRGEDEKQKLHRKMQLRQIIDRRQISVVYQPIVDLASSSLLGHEALCRGPAATPFEDAEFMFAASHELDLAAVLDDLCRETILTHPQTVSSGRKFFINVLPEVLVHGLLRAEPLLALLAERHLRPSDVVLELAERGGVDDYERLRQGLRPLREAGVKVAVDDIGSGYSSLRLVPEVEPDFMKIDMSLVRDIDVSRTKQGVLATIVDLASRLGSHVVCEGIETAAELATVHRMGVAYGQGFYLGEPAELPLVTYSGPAGLRKRRLATEGLAHA